MLNKSMTELKMSIPPAKHARKYRKKRHMTLDVARIRRYQNVEGGRLEVLESRVRSVSACYLPYTHSWVAVQNTSL